MSEEYDPEVNCWFCGYPLTAHGGLDGSGQTRLINDRLLIQEIGFARLDRMSSYMPPGWFEHCQRLLQAEVDMINEGARQVEMDEQEIERAERLNRLWEEGLL